MAKGTFITLESAPQKVRTTAQVERRKRRSRRTRLLNKENLKLRQKQNRESANAIKREIGCQDCGERDPVVLDFHHRERGDKVREISQLIKSSTWRSIESEIAKCAVLCSNCHRREHHRLRNAKPLVVIDPRPHIQLDLQVFEGDS